MANGETKSKAVALVPNQPVQTFEAATEMIRILKGRLEQVLPKHMTPERMMRVFQNAVSRNPTLLKCTVSSLQNAMLTAGEFGLEVNTPLGLCFLIPYRNGKTGDYEAQFQMGYQGICQLAYNTGRVPLIYAEAVHENDKFTLSLGLKRDLVHVPATDGNRGKILSYYAVVQISGFEPHFCHMTHDEIMAHAKRHSRAMQGGKQDSAWLAPEDSTAHQWMCKKTVLIQACKTAPKSIEDKWVKALYEDDDMEPAGVAPIDVTAHEISTPKTADALADRLEREAAERVKDEPEDTPPFDATPEQEPSVEHDTIPEPPQPTAVADAGTLF